MRNENPPILTKRPPGRPRKPDALTTAERSRNYRERLKQKRAEQLDESQPLSSKFIDLSVLPPWKRK